MSLRRIYTKQVGDFPKGFHIHHIKPRCEGGDERRGNLIALHPDDHVLIHKMRGDKICDSFIQVGSNRVGEDHPMFGKALSEETKSKISESLKGRELSEERKKLSASKGTRHPLYDPTCYWWTHPELGEHILTRYEMSQRFGTSSGQLGELIYGKYKSHKGWKIKKVNG